MICKKYTQLWYCLCFVSRIHAAGSVYPAATGSVQAGGMAPGLLPYPPPAYPAAAAVPQPAYPYPAVPAPGDVLYQ